MNIQTEKSFLIDLLQNSTDVAFIQKVKRFILNEIDFVVTLNKESDQMTYEVEDDMKNDEIDSQLEVQKIIEIWTSYSQYFRPLPQLDI